MSELIQNTARLLKKINNVVVILALVIIVFSFFSKKPRLEKALKDLDDLIAVFRPEELPESRILTDGSDPTAAAKMWPISGRIGSKWVNDYFISEIKSHELLKKQVIQFQYEGYNVVAKINFTNAEDVFESFQKMSLTFSLSSVRDVWNSLHDTQKIVTLSEVYPQYAAYESERKKFAYHNLELGDGPALFNSATGGITLKDSPIISQNNFTIVSIHDHEWLDQIDKYYSTTEGYNLVRETIRRTVQNATTAANPKTEYFLFGRMISNPNKHTSSIVGYGVDDEESQKSIADATLSSINNVLIPISAREILVNPLAKLLKEGPPDNNWQHGKFRYNFQDLDEATKGYQELDLAIIKNILTKEYERSVESVTIFGIHIPYSLVNRFGIVLLILSQAHFLLYFLHLKSNLRDSFSEINIPWLLFHKETSSKIAFFITSVLFPCAVSVSVLQQNIQNDQEPLAYSIFLILLQLAITSLLGKNIIHVWKYHKFGCP